jgi:hypothetical protein
MMMIRSLASESKVHEIFLSLPIGRESEDRISIAEIYENRSLRWRQTRTTVPVRFSFCLWKIWWQVPPTVVYLLYPSSVAVSCCYLDRSRPP